MINLTDRTTWRMAITGSLQLNWRELAQKSPECRDAQQGDDLMFGNSLVNDSDAALAAIAGDWFGTTMGGTQTTAIDKITAAKRAAENAADLLYGEGGADWYLMYLFDKIATSTDKAPANTIQVIPANPL